MSLREDGSWNDLYLAWLADLIEGSQSNIAQQNLQLTYKRAYASLQESKEKFTHPHQLQKLRFIGEKICKLLTKKVEKYCKENDMEMPRDSRNDVTFIPPTEPSATAAAKKKRQTTAKQYVPRHRTGGYAILLALRKLERQTGSKSNGAAKNEIIAHAKPFCETSMEPNPNMNSFYCGWNGIKTLTTKNLVFIRGKQFFLTNEGREVADKLRLVEKENESETVEQLWSTPQNSELSSPAPMHADKSDRTLRQETNIWAEGSFEIKVFVDNREIKNRENQTFFQDELNALGHKAEAQVLSLGDVVWIAEHVETGYQAILDTIMERKRVDDLISSLKDNRFTEQKFRLHRSTCKQVIYLVEHPPTASVPQNFQAAYQTALSQTAVVDNFFMKRTASAEDTVKYIATVTKHLKTYFEHRPLAVVTPSIVNYRQSLDQARETHQGFIGIDYDAFQKAMSKSGMLTVRDVYIKMLMTVRGITWDKAIEIQKIYKTPYHLWQAYHSLDNEERKKTLVQSALAHHILRKRVGKAASERLYEVWGS